MHGEHLRTLVWAWICSFIITSCVTLGKLSTFLGCFKNKQKALTEGCLRHSSHYIQMPGLLLYL